MSQLHHRLGEEITTVYAGLPDALQRLFQLEVERE